MLLVPPFKKEYYTNQFSKRSNVVIEAAPMHRYKRVEDIVHRLLRQSIPSTTIYNRQMHALYGPKSVFRKVPSFIGTRILWILGHSRLWREFLRFLYSFSPYAAYLPLIDQYKPDLIFVTTLFDRMDLGLMKAARKRRVKTVGMPKSWDSITSKCFMPIKPSVMLAQNEIIKGEAIRFGDMPSESICVVGIPQFDFYFKSMIVPRDEFLRTIGVPEGGKYILFTGGGLDLFPDECEVLGGIVKQMEKDPAYAGYSLVYRPHPNYGWCEGVASSSKRVIVASSYKRIRETASGWEFEQDDIRYLLNSLHHADVVLHMASTIAIETAVLDRPMVGIACDGATQKPFYRSSERYYSTDHYAVLARSGGMKIARTEEKIMESISLYLHDQSLDKKGRERIVKDELVYTDGKSGERIARKIREILTV